MNSLTDTSTNKANLNIFAYPKQETSFGFDLSCGEPGARCRIHHIVKFESSDIESGVSEAVSWQKSLSNLIYTKNDHTSKSLLVFINPVSGSGQAVNIWKNEVNQVLIDGQAQVTSIITESANHAKSYMQTANIRDYDAVLSIGGDGLFYEILQGITMRSDKDSVLQSIALVAIPGGTGNGLAKSVLFECDETFTPVNASYVALKGIDRPLDLSLVETKTQKQYSFLSLAWGLISDIDILSESLRFWGETRLYIAAVYFIVQKKMYKGKLSYIPVDNETNKGLQGGAYQVTPFDQPFGLINMMGFNNGSVVEVIEGDFVLFWAVQTSHAAGTMHSGPGVTLDDGVLTMMIIRNCSRCELLSLLLTIDEGKHVDEDKVEFIKAYAYRLEPVVFNSDADGIYSLDGEVVEYGPIQASVLPAAARVASTKKP